MFEFLLSFLVGKAYHRRFYYKVWLLRRKNKICQWFSKSFGGRNLIPCRSSLTLVTVIYR